MTRREAVARLTRRWNEQCEMFPTMRHDIPLRRYISANLAIVTRHELLTEYGKEDV